jgi:TNF receptor-associated factor 4
LPNGTSAQQFWHSTKRDRVVFVQDIPAELVCPVCDDVFDDPCAAPTCGHLLCRSCIATTAGETGRCFTCSRTAHPDDFVKDSGTAIKVGDTRCFCRNAVGVRTREDVSNRKSERAGTPAHATKTKAEQNPEVFVRRSDFHETACSRTVPLRELDDHEQECEFQTLMCDVCDEEGDVEVEVRLSPGKPENNPATENENNPANENENKLAEENSNLKETPPARLPIDGLITTPARCGFACLRRDMPSHQATCGHREVSCPYASKSGGTLCRWVGAARRARTKHAETCVAAPTPCPNGCGLLISASDLATHTRTVCQMQDIACASPDAEAGSQSGFDGNQKAWCDARCATVVKRKDLGKHRREACAFARAARCRLCRDLVSLRSASGHASERCARARRLCPNECGVSLPLGGDALREHDETVCQNAFAECPYKRCELCLSPNPGRLCAYTRLTLFFYYKSLGCFSVKRLTRRTLEEHLRHATGAHAELVRVGLLNAKTRSDSFRREVDSHRNTITADAEKTRAETSAYLESRLAGAVENAETARAEDTKTRTELKNGVSVLAAAITDLSQTTSGRMLELFDDIRDLRREFEAFKSVSETQIATLRIAVDAQADKAVSLFAQVSAQRDDAIGAHHALVTKVLEEEKHVWRADIDTQARVLREDLEGYKLGVNAKMRDAWDALRAAGRRF